MLATHITPTVKAIAPDGQKIMAYFAGKANISGWLGITASLTFLSGAIMYFMNFQTKYPPHTAQGRPPTPEQAAEMGALSARIERNGQILSIMLGITVVLMGTFQYISFLRQLSSL